MLSFVAHTAIENAHRHKNLLDFDRVLAMVDSYSSVVKRAIRRGGHLTMRFPHGAAWAAARAVAAARVAALALVGAAAASPAALTLSRGPDHVETITFTLDELAALPQVSIVTENEFTNGPVAYKGPLVRDVIDHLALGDVEALRFIAANDYYVEIPTSDFRRYNVILAMEADGQALSRREKGPLWLMYPISDHEELKDPLYIHRLIWQVVRIESP